MLMHDGDDRCLRANDEVDGVRRSPGRHRFQMWLVAVVSRVAGRIQRRVILEIDPGWMPE